MAAKKSKKMTSKKPKLEPRVVLRSPDPATVAGLTDKARLALMALYVEVAAGEPGENADMLGAWSTARLGVDALADIVLHRDDPRAHARRQVVEIVDRLRRGSDLVRALEVTRDYAVRGSIVPPRAARQYVKELRRLDLDELTDRAVPDEVIAAELAGEVGRRGGRERGAATILARVLVLHRNGVVDQTQVVAMRDAVAKAERRHVAMLSTPGADHT